MFTTGVLKVKADPDNLDSTAPRFCTEEGLRQQLQEFIADREVTRTAISDPIGPDGVRTEIQTRSQSGQAFPARGILQTDSQARSVPIIRLKPPPRDSYPRPGVFRNREHQPFGKDRVKNGEGEHPSALKAGRFPDRVPEDWRPRHPGWPHSAVPG
jgi:hypothetical protein